MNASIEILSGLNAKAPAAILVKAQGRCLLLDAGGALEAGADSGWALPQLPDAVLLTHDHVDHCAALHQVPAQVPVYATAPVAASLQTERDIRLLPLNGTLDIAGIKVTTGQAGHSLGGVWLHLAIGDGVFYSGDFSLESTLFAFDAPPVAGLALLDASYGLYDADQPACRAALEPWLEQPLLLPVPPSGRALEMALWLNDRPGCRWTLDSACRQQLERLHRLPAALLQPGVSARLARLTPEPFGDDVPVILAANPDGVGGEAGRLIEAQPWRAVLYTGYMPSVAQDQVERGRAHWQRWNVHPRLGDVLHLAKTLQARRVVPLFSRLDPRAAWQQALGCRLLTDTHIEI
ncbi:MBL fold metallo-hydrolase [Marinobacterium rhizophilum]|uniref:MBL fold metallo-hydrolase n=1 Tax=Marinobacterium rhizophilum TaxID=420402 RepID=A0ABY5HJ67_9GAMM|nr:MBL fold metallo-hydrolase [Marinobacterium rhizophilum]UTW11643.1 MBL fold metallo-hydrolase [Marinobacterium rhizophilum]